MRAFVNLTQLAGVALVVAAAALVSVALALLVAGFALCAVSWVHDPDRRRGPR